MRVAPRLFPALVILAVAAVVTWAARSPLGTSPGNFPPVLSDDFAEIVAQVDRHFVKHWEKQIIVPSEQADDLQILRRLSLSLCGTIPSLEEIRAFEADDKPARINRWTARIMADPRFADYFAERLARGFVGTEGGQFLIFRRDRFVDWLSTQLKQNRPTMKSSSG